jgi:hypothetical protein
MANSLGGRYAIRGFVLQVLTSLQAALDDQRSGFEWIEMRFEPVNEDAPVDLLWKLSDGTVIREQVKSSQRPIKTSSVTRWAEELSSGRPETETGINKLTLIGRPAGNKTLKQHGNTTIVWIQSYVELKTGILKSLRGIARKLDLNPAERWLEQIVLANLIGRMLEETAASVSKNTKIQKRTYRKETVRELRFTREHIYAQVRNLLAQSWEAKSERLGLQKDRAEELQVEIANWTGAWKEGGASYLKRIKALRQRFEDIDDWRQWVEVLVGRFLIKAANCSVEGAEVFWKENHAKEFARLQASAARRDHWAVASRYVLGRVFIELASGQRDSSNAMPESDFAELNSRRRDLIKRSYECFAGIQEEQVLPLRVCLPGIRSECPVERFERFLSISLASDPLIDFVPVPYRYRTVQATNVATNIFSQRIDGRLSGSIDDARFFLARAEDDYKSAIREAGGSPYMKLNILGAQACSWICEGSFGGSRRNTLFRRARRQFYRILDELLSSASSDVPKRKRLEWEAAWCATLAAVEPESSQQGLLDRMAKAISEYQGRYMSFKYALFDSGFQLLRLKSPLGGECINSLVSET